MRVPFLELLMLALPVVQQDAWEVSKYNDGCVAEAVFDGGSLPTHLSLGMTIEGHPFIVLQNLGWSTEDNKYYDIILKVDDNFFEGKAKGAKDGILIFYLTSEVMNKIVKGREIVPFLKIDDSREKILEKLELDGSFGAMIKVKKCVEDIISDSERAKKIQPDPFSNN